ncbi:hypothetical protein [Bacillus sp. C1]
MTLTKVMKWGALIGILSVGLNAFLYYVVGQENAQYAMYGGLLLSIVCATLMLVTRNN